MTAELYLGADVGGTAMKYVVADDDGHIIHRGEVPTAADNVAASLQRLCDVLEGRDRLAAVGLACAGIVDLDAGTLGRSPNLPGWERADLAGEVARVFGELPVALANDVNGALFGEFKAGAGRGYRNLVMIALGTGVGGGVLLDGRLLTGSHFGAGEIGHMVLDPDGPPCTCGGRGCLEAWSGSVGLLRSARSAAERTDSTTAFRDLAADRGPDLSPRDLFNLAGSGDATCLALFHEVGDRLGQAVGNLVNVLDPDCVIIGGGVAQAGDLILDPCRRQARKQILAEASKKVPIVPAELGPHAAAVGAAWLARESRPSA